MSASRHNRFISLFLSLILLFSSFACAKSDYTERNATAFSDEIPMSLSVYGASETVLDKAEAFEDRLNALINPDIPTSDVARFNTMEAGQLQVDEHVFNLVKLSIEYWNKTNGAFDVTLAPLSRLWRVDSEHIFDEHSHEMPNADELSAHKSYMNTVSAFEQDGKFYLKKTDSAATVDLGGIAKGYLTDLIDEYFSSEGVVSAMTDVGGNLMLTGMHVDSGGASEKWKVGVNNCFGAGYLCGILVTEGAVVTSGTYERFYQKDGVKYCHIIDPSTKMPIGVKRKDEQYENLQSYVVSCTVLSDSGAKSDALATAVCVLGIAEGKALLQQEGVSGIIVTSDKKYAVIGSVEFMQDYLITDMELV